MTGRLQRLAFQWFAREEIVPVARCVHFCGFCYGRGQYNPYETYLITVARDGAAAEARAQFIAFLQHYRPRHFGEALGLSLSREYPLWFYPWSRRRPPPPLCAGWLERPEDCPDILTHFSERGILRSRIAEEFDWLERALASIRQHGYRPEKFRSHINARKLLRGDGAAAWLLLDGNHRVAALSALGVKHVAVRFLPALTVRETALARWMQLRNGLYEAGDARRVFQLHFEGNSQARTTDSPAALLEGGE